MATSDFVVKNGLVVNEDALIRETTNSTSTTTGALVVNGGAGFANSITVGGASTFNNNLTVTGDLAVNGGDITTTATTFNLVNTNATTVNIAGAGTNVQIGAATGTTEINNNLNVIGDIDIDGGDLTASTASFNLLDSTVTTLNFARAATLITVGATTGTTNIRNATVTLDGTTLNINGSNPSIASSSTGTASIFNANISTINFGQAANISMGSTGGTTTVRGSLAVNGNTTLGDASSDTITINANTASVPNTLTFTIDDAVANNISYPVEVRHTTTGTPANNIGVGIEFIAETSNNNNEIGVTVEGQATSVTAGNEKFDFVVKTMTNGGSAAQAVRANNNTFTVGASSTATTINTQTSSALTITTGASGVTSPGNTVVVIGGAGGTTSGAGGQTEIRGGDASTSGVGGSVVVSAGNATGTNIIGANTVIEAGQGTGTGRSGQIIFKTGPGGTSGTGRNPLSTVLTLTEFGLDVPGDIVINGNLTVNGTSTTINSNTLTVDDKNIEIGSVTAVTGLQATLATGTAVINLTSGTTVGLIPGMVLTKTSGTGVFGASARVLSIQSSTQFTATVNHATAGSITFTAEGASDFTAEGGGITLKGTTDKTLTWSRINTRWESNQNFSAPVLVSTAATGTAPFTVSSTTRVSNLNAATAGTADTWTSSRTLTIGNTGKSVNGGSDVSWTLSEIGAYPATNPTGFITASDSITGTSAGVVRTVSGTSSAELVRGNMGDNDQARILVGATASNSGFLEIATADDGAEPIHVRQYTGVFTTLARTATLLDGSGNTSFPGTVTAPTFSGSLSGNASTATTLQNTRTINGTNFNGSANITTANWGTTRTLTIGNTGKSVNGGADVSWSTSEIGLDGSLGNGTIGITRARFNYPAGRKLNPDEEFLVGINGLSLYNNSGGSNVVITRLTGQASIPNSTGAIVRITYNGAGTVSPGTGGFSFGTGTRANARFIARFLARVPAGRNIIWASNSTGTAGTSGWITPNAGTGLWEEYAYEVVCGSSGTFSSTNFFYLDGSAAYTWDIASATVIDVTDKQTWAGNRITTGAVGNTGEVTGQWTLTSGSTWQATFADLAEYYPSDEEYEPGTVLIFGGSSELTIATEANDRKLAGVVSTNPAYIMNAGCEGTRVCLALQGRVPVKVIGTVERGDMLVPSSVPGHAMVNNNPSYGCVIGKAIESKTTEEPGLILVSINI
jgi:hypothetical protein